ncbi:hypothetical protein [Streptomyces luteogriseus]|uniref:hypothetical protein n=1 Tax=Streptomyces luteogriseus TaxID=68233 RepID=UPI0036C7EECB
MLELLCAVTAAGLAVRAQNTVTRQRDEAVALRAAAESVRLSRHSPSLAVQIVLAAYRQSPQGRTQDALLSTLSVASMGSRALGSRPAGGHPPSTPRPGTHRP